MKRDKRVITTIAEKPAYGGLAVARTESGKIILVKGALPGEKVLAEIQDDHRDYFMATAVEILDHSTERVTPECPHYGVCGGCQMQHASYREQVRMKEDILTEAVARSLGQNIKLTHTFSSIEHWGYRLRGQFKTSKDSIGFFREKSDAVVNISCCPIMSASVNNLLSKIRSVLDPAVNEIHISSASGSTALVRLRSEIKNHDAPQKIASELMHSGLTGVTIETKKGYLQFGNPHIQLDLCGYKYYASSLSFFQNNWQLNNIIVKFIADYIHSCPAGNIVDLYSGAGNLALPAANYAKNIVCVEENPHAVQDGIKNAQANALLNCEFINLSAEKFEIPAATDILILDPPRPGLTNRTMGNVLQASPARIIYMSCNPSTFARDLKKLTQHYRLSQLSMIDFFPQTYHVETVVLMSRVDK
ncbi:MAG: class I SAM-dependent RNA methyltransferase [Dissulfurispiraceae bacterium]|nr:class I SAM-dependent RNA methyltransferase [Dissulfurispiraceae bacterium]